MKVVANAGPLIALGRIDQIGLLPALYGQLYIPRAVQREVVSEAGERPGAAEVGRADWIRVVDVGDTMAVQLLRERLDAGESEAIVLAMSMEADLLLMDEARGRRAAEARGIAVSGTLGTLIAAKHRGLVALVTPLLDALQAQGFRMDEELYQAVRGLAGEQER